MAQPFERIAQLGLIRPERRADGASAPARLEALCDDGFLQGGFAVDLQVRPDELLGPLTRWVGGSALRLKVVDVFEQGDVIQLAIERQGRAEVWEVMSVRALVDAMNDAFAGDRAARFVAVLGEWNDALQLWAVPKAKRSALLAEPWFRPENAGHF